MLEKWGVALDPVHAAVEKKVGRGGYPSQEEIDYVPCVRKGNDLALDKAERQGNTYVQHRAYPAEHRVQWRQGCGEYPQSFWLWKVRIQVFEFLG